MHIQTLLKTIVTVLVFIGFVGKALSEPISFFQLDDIQYDEAIAAPEDQFGYEIGDRPVRYSDMISYLTSIADLSDRISVETIGYSHELRPLLTFTVTSKDNHSRLEDIRQAHLARLSGKTTSDDIPMVLWINFGVHGAESSGMDAAIPLIYHFAAAQGEAVNTMLDNAVMLFTVAFNPDGHARRIDHTETFWSYGDNTDPNDAAHNLWVEARTNHYWFDLNRQWLLLTQPESQAWVKKWHEWKPMVSADYHEMGSNSAYYFHPGEPLRRNPLIPERARDLTFEIARYHAAFMDSEARLYATEENFDNFYVGKGSTYPQVNGSLGILFEIGAARGGRIQTERGLVEHADNVRTQFRTALTTLGGALSLRDDITDYQVDFFKQSLRQATNSRQRGWVFTAEGDPERANRFVRLLRTHDINVYRTKSDIRSNGHTFKADQSYIVPSAQLHATMIRSIFERRTEFAENIFYDVSGWTVPLMYDLDYAPVSGGFPIDTDQDPHRADPSQSIRTPDKAPYAYAFDWSHSFAPKALSRLHAKNVRVRAAKDEFDTLTTQGRTVFGRGSIIVPLARQTLSDDEIHALMTQIAQEDRVPVHAVTSGLTPVQGRDLGAWNIFDVLKPPKVVLAFDAGLARYDAGEVWWTLDYRHNMAVTLVPKDRLGSINWPDYTHLILVGGNGQLTEKLTDELKTWVQAGGSVIALRQSALWAQKAFLDLESTKDNEETPTPRHNVSEMNTRQAEHFIGGAIFATDLDTSHPLGFGFPDRDLPVHRNTTFTLERPEDPFAVPVQYTDQPLLTGYASDKRIREIAGTPAVTTHKMGAGSIILMADNPVFRGTYPGTEKLLMNAIFFSNVIDRARGGHSEH